MRKHGLKILGLALMAAIGLMAFSASSALAVNLNLGDEPETGEAGIFLSGGVERPKGATKETISGSSTEGAILIPGKSAEIVCKKGTTVQNAIGETAYIQNEFANWKTGSSKSGGHGHLSFLFEECRVEQINPTTGGLTGTELTKCTEELNKETSPVNKHHVTIDALVLVKKHDGVTYFIIEPLIASKAKAEEAEKLTLPFTTLKFGGVCSLPVNPPITGSLAIKAPAADANKPLLSVETFSEAGKALQALLGTKLKFGVNEAFVKGEGEVKLTGTGAALSWGAM